ncbi:MAG: hypothetical protein NT068_03450 [Candidatus Nomurabacteria bacterium]|nr:hypothetical protein [Candidatus Nomurabacteria bacterium]
MSNRTRAKRKARNKELNILKRMKNPKSICLVEDTKKYLKEWKKLFEEIDPDIEVFIDVNKLAWHSVERKTGLEHSRIVDITHDVYMLVIIRFPFLNEKYLFCGNDTAYERSSVIPLEDPYWCDTITEIVTWQELYERVVAIVNNERGQIPKPAPVT